MGHVQIQFLNTFKKCILAAVLAIRTTMRRTPTRSLREVNFIVVNIILFATSCKQNEYKGRVSHTPLKKKKNKIPVFVNFFYLDGYILYQ